MVVETVVCRLDRRIDPMRRGSVLIVVDSFEIDLVDRIDVVGQILPDKRVAVVQHLVDNAAVPFLVGSVAGLAVVPID